MSSSKHTPLEEPPINPAKFFPWLKHASEKFWADVPLNENVYDFQIQAGTKWNPGLTKGQIAQFEADLGFGFPEIFKQYLYVMNGTDTDTINIYARCGEPPRYATGFNAYPKDLMAMKAKIQWIYDACHVTCTQIEAEAIPHIIPIIVHRFLVADRCLTNPVLSMYKSDIIPYSSNLMVFLMDEIFRDHRQDPNLPNDLHIKYWLD